MLLACPNCDARYDVPDSAIPEAGRDVQCSNCGHAWFQLPAESVSDGLAGAFAEDRTGADFAETSGGEGNTAERSAKKYEGAAASREPDVVAGIADVAEAEAAPAHSADLTGPNMTGTDALKAALAGKAAAAPVAPPAPAAEPVRRDLDEAVLEILREEAEREASARKAEAQRNTNRRAEADTGLQSQPELSIPAPTPEMTAQQKRLAMLRGEDLDEPEPARPTARRDLLPDVEEINSTLQPDDNRFDPEAEVDSLPDLTRGSFRTGFLLAILVLVIAALLYVFSDRIVAAVPALEGALQAYVLFVDNLRNWLNSLMDDATQALTGDPQTGG
ncbi:MJ0042 family finger-like domain-containing protein [Rhodobacter sp. 24-YEA-8]|nr:MJ0042 family finger-like domain-containing protein [Rhodobacter sp. 24-YEA-8]